MHLHSQDLAQQKMNELKNIFPEIFEDGVINYDKFKTILGENVDDKSEHYSFNWSGKKECYQTIKAKTNATLKVDDDKTVPDGENVFIEGDNLEVLKLLQNAYHKKVKMIYIDPPYNKDKDFVYKDTWGDTIQNYMAQTDQLREEGYTSTKTSSTGRRHTNWLNMIYPRLWLSRNLLRDDGVIFVSIDDDEVANLRKVMDEIYGEENFVAQFIWQKASGNQNDNKYIAVSHEYILCYSKNKDIFSAYNLSPSKEMINAYNLEDEYIKTRGKYYLRNLNDFSIGDRPGLHYNIECPDKSILNGKKHQWRCDKNRFEWRLSENRIVFEKNENNAWEVFYKQYINESKEEIIKDENGNILSYGKTADSMLVKIASTGDGTKDIKNIFEKSNPFSYPKPIKLIKHLLKIGTKNNDIILDFFAGSGTTAHAVMDLNAEDGGNRKYILVQLPEATDEKSEAYKAGYTKISDITKERIKRVIQKLDYKDGFKSFYLDNSNFQMFQELKKRPNDSLETIEKMLKMSVFQENILTQGAKELDLVYEVGLKNGFTLSAKRQTLQSGVYNFTRLYEEEREFYFCFDKEIANDIVNAVPKAAKLICYEKALGDSVKLNLHSNLDLETL